MSDVPSSTAKIQIEALRFRSAVSESVTQIIAGGVNGLLDRVTTLEGATPSALQAQEFTSNGTFNVPVGVSEVIVFGIGGGGGGGGGEGGGGGGGAPFGVRRVAVTPSGTATVVIGGGGNGGATLGDGVDGALSSFASLQFLGGKAGTHNAKEGVGGAGGSTGARGGNGSFSVLLIEDGEFSAHFAGGSRGGAQFSGGGGGAGPYGVGGDGGAFLVADDGDNAGVNTGAGGGGGGGTGGNPGVGGNGGSGRIVVMWAAP